MGLENNLQPLIHFVINFLFIAGETSALLRIWVKGFVLKNFGWDDWSMVIVAIVNCGQHAILYCFVATGAGLHQEEVLARDPTALSRMLQFLFAEEIWYLFLHFWIKMSFLLFFLRLSPSLKFKIAIYCVIAANVLVTVGTWTLYCLQCIPIEAYWYPEKHPDVKCLSFGLSLWLPATSLIAVDFAIFILPLRTVLTLQMSVKRRLQTLAVITTGGTSVLVSCLRLIVIQRFTVSPDFIWEVGNICIVSAAEMEVAILASNMPGLRALYKSWRGGTLSSAGRSKQTGGSNGNSYAPAQDSKGVPLSNLFPKRSAKGAERLEDDEDYDDDDGHHRRKTGEHSSTRELTKRTDSDEELAVTGNGAIVVTKAYDVHEEREYNPPEPGSWTDASRFNNMMK